MSAATRTAADGELETVATSRLAMSSLTGTRLWNDLPRSPLERQHRPAQELFDEGPVEAHVRANGGDLVRPRVGAGARQRRMAGTSSMIENTMKAAMRTTGTN